MSKKNDLNSLFKEEPKANASQDFASMFEQSLETTQRQLRVGDALKAEILTIGKEESFVSTGTPTDALIMTADLLDENKQPKYKVGEVIEVIVMKVRHDEIRVTRKGAKGAPVELENLEDAYDMELPVEGKVSEVVNGGYRVIVQGQTAFCPISQLDSKPIKDPASMLGKKFEFIITQFDGRKKNIVVSRRKLLDLQKAEHEGEWMQNHSVGDIVSGVVTRTEAYGAFVEVAPGVEGLVHVSEIGFVRLRHAAEGAAVGDQVQVKILKINEEEGRLKISLSIKQAGGVGDPWMLIPQQYPVGSVIDATVDNKAAFGLFVVIAPGINGLLPTSKWRDSADAKKYDNLRKGDPIKVRIDEIKFEERKIALGLPGEEEDNSWREYKNTQSFGSLASAFSQAKGKK